jgi:hypothetical protein
MPAHCLSCKRRRPTRKSYVTATSSAHPGKEAALACIIRLQQRLVATAASTCSCLHGRNRQKTGHGAVHSTRPASAALLPQSRPWSQPGHTATSVITMHTIRSRSERAVMQLTWSRAPATCGPSLRINTDRSSTPPTPPPPMTIQQESSPLPSAAPPTPEHKLLLLPLPSFFGTYLSPKLETANMSSKKQRPKQVGIRHASSTWSQTSVPW